MTGRSVFPANEDCPGRGSVGAARRAPGVGKLRQDEHLIVFGRGGLVGR
jgi:hypothetical protein